MEKCYCIISFGLLFLFSACWTGLGKLGTLVKNPGIKISSFSKHALNQVITRGVSTSIIQKTIGNPVAVLKQSNGTYLYLTNEAGVVLNSSGKVITTYPASMFDVEVTSFLKMIK
ncbi:MAG: hypothetical protein ACLVKO_08145 [Dysgonomonas sp.]